MSLLVVPALVGFLTSHLLFSVSLVFIGGVFTDYARRQAWVALGIGVGVHTMVLLFLTIRGWLAAPDGVKLWEYATHLSPYGDTALWMVGITLTLALAVWCCCNKQ